MTSKNIYYERKFLGLCGNCGGPKQAARVCQDCVKNQRKLRADRIKNNLCYQCPTPQYAGRKHCFKHIVMILAKESMGSCKFAEFLCELLFEQKELCNYCEIHIEICSNAAIDHIQPISRFPELRNQLNNIQWLCKRCNQAKAAQTESELREFALMIINRIPE